MDGTLASLYMDAITITPELFTQAFPAGVDLAMTSPPMLPQHLPRTHRGQGQLVAHATVGQIRHLIQHLAAIQEGVLDLSGTPPSDPRFQPMANK